MGVYFNSRALFLIFFIDVIKEPCIHLALARWLGSYTCLAVRAWSSHHCFHTTCIALVLSLTFQVVAGSTFAVDKFLRTGRENYVHFLTHFHSDHYQVLSSTWDLPIYCSPVSVLHFCFVLFFFSFSTRQTDIRFSELFPECNMIIPIAQISFPSDSFFVGFAGN